MKTETEKNCETPGVCKNSMAAVDFWKKNASKQAASTAESLFVICLDNDRHFTGCHEVQTKVFSSPALLADEIFSADFLKGVEEFIFLHHRPGVAPTATDADKARARALILEGTKRKCDLLDYIIVGRTNEKFEKGFFGLAHLKRSFHSENPFPPRKAKPQKQAPVSNTKERGKQ